MKPEAALQARISKSIKREHPRSWVFHPVGNPFQESGIPDLLVCVEGMLFGLEIKHPKPGETPRRARSRTSPIQRAQLRRIVRSGGYAGTVLTPQEALSLISRGLRDR